MREYSIEIRSYDCHPETCCHEEHFSWWVVEHKSLNGSSIYKTQSWVEGFDTKKEAEEELLRYKR